MFTKWESFDFQEEASVWKQSIFLLSVFERCRLGLGSPGTLPRPSSRWFYTNIHVYKWSMCLLKEACTVVLHSGLCPYTAPSPPALPCSIKSKAVSELKPSHAPLPSAPSTCLGSQGSCAPQESAHVQQHLHPALLLENIHRHPAHRGFWISKPRRQKDLFHYRTWLCVTFCSKDIQRTIRGTCEKKSHPLPCWYKNLFFWNSEELFGTLTQQIIKQVKCQKLFVSPTLLFFHKCL